MGRVSLDKAKMHKLAGGEQTMNLMERRGEEIVDAAKDVFRANSRGRSSPNPAEQYINKFRVYRNGKTYIVTNTDREAMFVEFGVYRATKQRLGYAPLRKGLDIVASIYG